MPEGPSLIILREQAQIFARKRVAAVEGNSKIDQARIVGQRIVALRTWGKHFLIEFGGFAIRIHLLMFGRYCINERKPDKPIRLGLRFADGQELNFYNCASRYIEGDLDDTYDWSADVMSEQWNAGAARKKLRAMPDILVCDALLDQNVFAGVGNIIKNEVLFRIHVHPCSKVGALPPAKLREMVEEARRYSFQFLEWKKAYVLRKHWLVHNKGMCPRCEIKLTRDYLGTTNRRSFFCQRCQIRYSRKPVPRRLVAKKAAPQKRARTARSQPIR
jgi:endonuclease-8